MPRIASLENVPPFNFLQNAYTGFNLLHAELITGLKNVPKVLLVSNQAWFVGRKIITMNLEIRKKATH
jgi:hypothetical protein